MAILSTMSTFISIVALVIVIIASYHTCEAALCTKRSHPPDEKPRLLLIHGFRSGAHSFYKPLLHLEAMGYNCTVINLKGAGIDLTDSLTIETFEQYNEPADQFMARLGKDEKVVLIGHSAGGVSVTKLLHDYTDKVALAMYFSATMLKYNYWTCEDLQIGSPYFRESKCNASCPELPDPTCFEKMILADGFTMESQSEDETLEGMLARPGPYRALMTAKIPQADSEKMSAIQRVPRVYVTSRSDTIYAPDKQDAMISLWPPCEVIPVKNDHHLGYDKPGLFAALVVDATRYV